MTKIMKILIGYDGSECAGAALDELKGAGLPQEAEALVISVAERWLTPLPIQETSQAGNAESTAEPLLEPQALAKQAIERLRSSFPSWKLKAQAEIGSPAGVLLEKADEWRPDLIVVGSHGRTALGRFVLGSVSQKLATEARCSVRIGRPHLIETLRAMRVLIGVDGSAGAEAAVRAVAARAWPIGTEVRLITLAGTYFNVERARNIVDLASAIQKELGTELSHAGLTVSFRVDAGDPREVIVQEAGRWGADSIFVGARGLTPIRRLLLGSVSAAVAARAHCSVEIVRADY